MFHPSPSVAGQCQRAIGVFPSYRAIARALYELRDARFPMEQVSVITRDFVHQQAIAPLEAHPSQTLGRTPPTQDTHAHAGAAQGAIRGGTLGGLAGLLVGLESLTIPGIGPLVMAGATATTLASTLAGEAVGATVGGLTGAFIGMGIPEPRAQRYDERITQGGYLAIVDGTAEEMALADPILRRDIEEYGVYAVPDGQTIPLPPAPHEPNPDLGRNKYVMGRFADRHTTEAAIANLGAIRFPMPQVSLIVRRVERPDRFGRVEVRDRFDAAPLGMPVDHARYYNDRLDQGDYLILIQGTEAEAHRAINSLRGHRVQDWQMYDPTLIASTPSHASGGSGSGANPFVLPDSAAHLDEPVIRPTRQAIAAFSHRQEVEQAIALLSQGGIPLGRMFLMNPYFEQRGQLTGIHLRNRFDAVRFGIPAERADYYNRRFNQGAYILLIRGTTEEIDRVMDLLQHHQTQEWQDHEPTPRRTSPRRTTTPGATAHRSNRGDRTLAPDVIIIDRRHETR